VDPKVVENIDYININFGVCFYDVFNTSFKSCRCDTRFYSAFYHWTIDAKI